MRPSQLSLALGILGLVYTLGLIVGLIYVAANKPQNERAATYTIVGLGLFVVSNLSRLLVTPLVARFDTGFDNSFIFINFIQTVLASLAVFSLVKAAYVASRPKQDPQPQVAPNSLDHQPPFRPLDQQL